MISLFQHADEVEALLKAVHLLSSIAECKCPSHVNRGVLVSTDDVHVDVDVTVSAHSPVYCSLVSTAAPKDEEVLGLLTVKPSFALQDGRHL